MERFSYLKDIPIDFTLKPVDTIVIGQHTKVEGEDRYIAKAVEASHLISAMTNVVLEGADLPSHLTLMQSKVDDAQEQATSSASSASKSEQSHQQAAEQAQISEGHASTAANMRDQTAQIKMQCQQHEESSASNAELSSRNASAAGESEVKAQEFADICEGFAGGLVSVLTLNVVNLTATAKMDGIA